MNQPFPLQLFDLLEKHRRCDRQNLLLVVAGDDDPQNRKILGCVLFQSFHRILIYHICQLFSILRAKKTRKGLSVLMTEPCPCSISVISIVNMCIEKSKKSVLFLRMGP